MKYWIAGLTALVASCIVTPSANAVDVCGYTATGVQGVNCPVRNGQTVCLSVSTAIGPCDTDVECFGGPGFFCRATLIAKSGPEAQCPFSSVRPRGFNCFAKRLLVNPTSTPTGPPIETETATFTPTDTPEAETPTPTDTVPAGATATDTPAELTPTETATGTPTGTAAATATDTPQEATPTETATEVPPATATETATGTPTGTAAASLVLRF
jgi:hypothetical protein